MRFDMTRLLLALALFLNSGFAFGVDRTIACDGTDCKVRIYSRVGSTLTESARIEGGGITPVANVIATDDNKVLTAADNRHQVFTGFTTSRDVTLPSSGIIANEVWRIENTTDKDLVLKSSDGSEFTVANGANFAGSIQKGYVLLRSKQAAPTTPAHWQVIDVFDMLQVVTSTASGCTVNQTVVFMFRRHNNVVNVSSRQGTNCTAQGGAVSIGFNAATVPTRMRWCPNCGNSIAIGAFRNNGAFEATIIDMGQDGGLTFYRSPTGGALSGSISVGRDSGGGETCNWSYTQQPN